MKRLLYCMLMLHATHLFTSNLEIVNDATCQIFVSDHLKQGMLLAPGQSNVFSSQGSVATLYIYTEQDQIQHTFQLKFCITEKFGSSRKTTLLYNDIAQNNVQYLHPNRFSITTPENFPLPQQKQQYNPIHDPRPQPPSFDKDSLTPGDMSPAMVQGLLDKITAVKNQQTQHFQPPETHQQSEPMQHPVGHRKQPSAEQSQTESSPSSHKPARPAQSKRARNLQRGPR